MARVPRRPVVRHGHGERADFLTFYILRGNIKRGLAAAVRLRHRDDIALGQDADGLCGQQLRVARTNADAV